MEKAFQKISKDRQTMESFVHKVETAKIMIQNGDLDSGEPKALERIRDLLEFSRDFVNNICNWNDQINFCLRFYSKTVLPNSEFLLRKISEIKV